MPNVIVAAGVLILDKGIQTFLFGRGGTGVGCTRWNIMAGVNKENIYL
jgi:hypothetical protein